MRVLHFTDAKNLSWAVPYAEHIESLSTYCAEQAILCRNGGDLERTAKEYRIPVITWSPIISGIPAMSPGFVRVIRSFKPDIIHTRLSSAAGIAGFWRKYHGVPVISTFDKPAKRKYYTGTSRCISCAEWLKDYMVKVQGIDAGKIDVIHNPVNAAKFSRDERIRTEFRKSLGLSENDILFAGMGIYIHRKGFDVLIKAFARVREMYRGSESLSLVLIGGEGEKGMRESYESLAGELGVKIIMPPDFVRDVRAWLWASDIFIMPSREEGFSVALLEALASGLPAVVSDIEPFTEIIRPELNNGLTAKKDNPESFACAMNELLMSGKNGRGRIAENSLSMIRREFSPGVSAKKTFSVYERVMSESS